MPWPVHPKHMSPPQTATSAGVLTLIIISPPMTKGLNTVRKQYTEAGSKLKYISSSIKYPSFSLDLMVSFTNWITTCTVFNFMQNDCNPLVTCQTISVNIGKLSSVWLKTIKRTLHYFFLSVLFNFEATLRQKSSLKLYLLYCTLLTSPNQYNHSHYKCNSLTGQSYQG